MHKYLIILSFILLTFTSFGQRKILQFSGIVVTEDSLQAVPYTSIYVINKALGTTTDFYGYFSFVASAGDTVQFSAVGYKRNIFVVPEEFTDEKYTLIHVLHNDTVMLNETVVYPWPSKEQFKQAFLTLNIPDDDVERARKNLSQEELAKRAEELPVSGSLAFKYQMQQRNDQLYYAGQAPPIQILNPFAWAKFIESWRNGDFKRKKD
tara:strand:+ start:12834 stop:13457 length:624 start_codon:yes stop_codon:yes gene_type:complete